MSPRLGARLGSAAFAVGVLVMFAGLMLRRKDKGLELMLACLAVGAPIALAGLVLVVGALRRVSRELGDVSSKAEASLRQLIAEKRAGPPPSAGL